MEDSKPVKKEESLTQQRLAWKLTSAGDRGDLNEP